MRQNISFLFIFFFNEYLMFRVSLVVKRRPEEGQRYCFNYVAVYLQVLVQFITTQNRLKIYFSKKTSFKEPILLITCFLVRYYIKVVSYNFSL